MVRKYCNKWLQAAFCVTLLFGAAQLCGCTGDTGPQGPPGPTGPTGPAGGGGTPPDGGGSGAVTQETCNICHGTGKIVDIAVAHPDPTGADVTLSGITLTNTGGIPVVSFNAATSDGPVTDLTLDDFRFMIADLVPADTATASQGTWPTPYFERWADERTGNDRSGNPNPHGTFDDTDAANGNYAYTFTTGFADATTEAPEYNEAHTQRLVIVVSGHDDALGDALTNNTVGYLDFVTATAGGTVTTSVSQRLFVTADACKKCHGAPFQQAAHADRYLDTRSCVVCHSPIGHYGDTMQTDTAYLAPLIHQIHAAIDNPEFANQVRGLGFGGVTYPQDIRDCVVCHTNSGDQGLGTGDMIDNWKEHPTDKICGSCHVDVDFASGANHPGGQVTNNECTVCHKPTVSSDIAKSVTDAHAIIPDAVDIPEFDVTLNITDPTNGSFYEAGEAPEVHVTLTEHGTQIAVDPSIYTTPQDEAGKTGGGLRVASVYVYGPRAKSVPVLATGTVTDSNFDITTDTPVQGHDMFVGGTDPQVTTDATGFGYQLLPITADMESGTYMVRIRIGDYGRVGSGNYHIESTAFANIQIGPDTPSEKVAGDNCIDCHGTGTAEFHNERHAVVFNTDECLACHDQSGNFAIPIANRVHAVHSANSAGDLYTIAGGERDWSDVTFPQNIQHLQWDDGVPRCIACHSSGNDTYETLPYMMPCAGCHVGEDGVIDHMRQNGGPF